LTHQPGLWTTEDDLMIQRVGEPGFYPVIVFDLDGTLLRGTTVSLLLAQWLGQTEEIAALERAFHAHEISNSVVADTSAGWLAGQSTADAWRVLMDGTWIAGMAETFRALADAGVSLLLGHRLITFNRRGYPGSGAAPRDWRAHAADAAELVESLDVAPVAVVAHSSGAIAALELAVCRPELVGSLVLLDPAFGAAHNLTPAFAGAVVKARLLWLVGRRRRAIDGWLRFVTSYSTGGSAFERMGEERREALRANAEGVFADLASGDGSHIGAAELASIRAPVNIITATLSPAFLQKTSAALAKRLPSATTRSLPGAGHAMAFDQPDELLAELRIALDASSSPAVDG